MKDFDLDELKAMGIAIDPHTPIPTPDKIELPKKIEVKEEITERDKILKRMNEIAAEWGGEGQIPLKNEYWTLRNRLDKDKELP